MRRNSSWSLGRLPPLGGVAVARRLSHDARGRSNIDRAPTYPASAMPTHQATAITALLPIGVPRSSPRVVSMRGVKGWFSANQRTPAGIAWVGTKALLMKGRTCGAPLPRAQLVARVAGSCPQPRRLTQGQGQAAIRMLAHCRSLAGSCWV
jgi:hypothetical protein